MRMFTVGSRSPSPLSDFMVPIIVRSPVPAVCNYAQVMGALGQREGGNTPVLTAVRDKEKIFLDHYKYTWGVDDYLNTRVENFKAAKINWHKESTNVLRHLEDNGGVICVTCPESKCQKRD